MNEPFPKSTRVPVWTYPVFFASGAAALIYQVVWQRALFVIYGINVEAVTVVVTAFMLGLGIGSALGGIVSKRESVNLLRWFGFVELGIGAFGAISLPLLSAVGGATVLASPLTVALLTFALVLVPTVLMGSTLPMLVAYLVGRSASVGEAVGGLYFTNTLGSALASIATVVLLLRHLGQSGSVYAAVLVNLGVAVFALYQSRRGAAA